MRADRLLSLLLLLQGRGKIKARELADQLEVSTRTVYRDVDALSRAGVPVYAEAGPAGGIALVGDYRTRLTGLSDDEAEALAAFRVPASLSGVGLSTSLRTALVKLMASLPAAQQVAVDHAKGRLHIDSSPWFAEKPDSEALSTLREAVWTDRRLAFRYQRRDGSTSPVRANPYGLVSKLDRWYLVAETSKRISVFRVSRVSEARLLRQVFTRPAAFELERFWKEWLAQLSARRPKYEVRFRVAPTAERKLLELAAGWGPEQLESAPRDSKGWRTVTLDFEREPFAVASLAAVGSGLEVEAPRELRRRLRHLARELRLTYGDES